MERPVERQRLPYPIKADGAPPGAGTGAATRATLPAPELEPSLKSIKKTDTAQYVERLEAKLQELQAENKNLKRQLAQSRGGLGACHVLG